MGWSVWRRGRPVRVGKVPDARMLVPQARRQAGRVKRTQPEITIPAAKLAEQVKRGR